MHCGRNRTVVGDRVGLGEVRQHKRGRAAQLYRALSAHKRKQPRSLSEGFLQPGGAGPAARDTHGFATRILVRDVQDVTAFAAALRALFGRARVAPATGARVGGGTTRANVEGGIFGGGGGCPKARRRAV